MMAGAAKLGSSTGKKGKMLKGLKRTAPAEGARGKSMLGGSMGGKSKKGRTA
jgi:hypothetical protein